MREGTADDRLVAAWSGTLADRVSSLLHLQHTAQTADVNCCNRQHNGHTWEPHMVSPHQVPATL